MKKRFIRYALVLMAPLVLGAAFIITPRAAGPNLQVVGGGTLGRLTKWTGFTSGNSVIGNSTIYEDKFGMVGIGTDSPTSRLTVQGLIEGTGGVKFPDGTIQTTAGVAPNQAVNSLNGLTGELALAAGPNITITPSGNTLTIASNTANPALSAFQAELFFLLQDGDQVDTQALVTPPANKRLVIEYVSIRATTANGFVDRCSLGINLNGTSISHSIMPIRLPEQSSNIFVVDKQVRLYADHVFLFFGRSSSMGVASVDITISGHLVDIP